MTSIVYLIPGFGESFSKVPRIPAYRRIRNRFISRGIEPQTIDINWEYKTMTDYVKQFREVVDKGRATEFYFLGFSFGAMIAFIASKHFIPKAQILCSLSPYFKEDLKYTSKRAKLYLGKRRLRDFRNHSFDDLSPNVKCKTLLVVGSLEHKTALARASDARKKLDNAELFVSNDSGHDISQSTYLQTLEEVIDIL